MIKQKNFSQPKTEGHMNCGTMCECVNELMFECVNVWICEYVNVWMCECVNVWMCECVNVWMCECVNVWMFKCVNVTVLITALTLNDVFTMESEDEQYTCIMGITMFNNYSRQLAFMPNLLLFLLDFLCLTVLIHFQMLFHWKIVVMSEWMTSSASMKSEVCCECVNVWMCECVDVWMCECVNMWISEFVLLYFWPIINVFLPFLSTFCLYVTRYGPLFSTLDLNF